jgi:hypothetical protein
MDQALIELKQCERELWAATQAVRRLQHKLATLRGWRVSLAWEAAEEALEALHGMPMWEAYHLPDMPENFRHWRQKYSDKVL